MASVNNIIDGRGFVTEKSAESSTSLTINSGPVVLSDVFSGYRTSVLAVSGSLALTSTISQRLVLVDASSARAVLSLPDVSSLNGFVVTLKKIDSTVNEVEVRGSGSQTIDGSATKVITEPYTALTLVSHEGKWHLI